MNLSTEEIEILKWAEPDGMCAIVWPTGADDTLYLAGKHLEGLGLLENIQHSPEQWIITLAGRDALAVNEANWKPRRWWQFWRLRRKELAYPDEASMVSPADRGSP